MTRPTRYLALPALVLFACQTWSGANDWSSIGPPGGQINKVVFEPTNASRAYALTEGGLYRSSDGGVSWTLLSKDFFDPPTDIALDPSSVNRFVLLASGGRLYVPTDDGASTAELATFSTVQAATQIEYNADGSGLFLTSDLRVYRSIDGGHSWQERTPIPGPGSFVTSFAAHPRQPNTLYAVVDYVSAYVSTDAGATWQHFNLPTANQIQAFAVSPAASSTIWVGDSYGLWQSIDGGVHWTLAANSNNATAVAVDPVNPLNVYSGHYPAGLFKSSDGGGHWIHLADNIPDSQIRTIAVDSTTGRRALLGTFEGLWSSGDSGANWIQSNSGIIAWTVLTLSPVAASDRIYMNVAGGGVHYVQSGADATSAVNNEALRQFSFNGRILSVSALAAQAIGHDRLFASELDSLFRSEDGGSSWARLSSASPSLIEVAILAASPINTQAILAASWNHLSYSVDGGDSWRESSGLPASPSTAALTMSQSSTAYAAPWTTDTTGMTIGHGVYKSVDAGASWVPANSGISSRLVSAIAVDPTNPMVVYAAAAPLLFKSVDGGGSWSTLPWTAGQSPAPEALAIDPVHPQIVYSASPNRVGRSIDGGVTWENLWTRVTPVLVPRTMLVDPVRPDTLLVGSDRLGTQKIVIQPDLALLATGTSGTVANGAAVSYQYTASNRGPFHATGVRVAIGMPGSSTNIVAGTSAGTCTVANAVVNCMIGNLLNGANAQISISAAQPVNGSFQVSGAIAGDQGDSQTGNNKTANALMVAAISDLAVAVSGATNATEGDPLNYTLTASNAGPNAATSVSLTYQLAGGLTVSSTSSSQASCSATGSTTVTCTIASLAAGASAIMSVVATASISGSFHNSASIIATELDTNPANNMASIDSQVVSRVTSGGGSGGGGSMTAPSVLILLALVLCRGRHFVTVTQRGRLPQFIPPASRAAKQAATARLPARQKL